MNDSFETFLWIFGIISVVLLIIAGIILGSSKLNTYLEENECSELEARGYKTIVIQEGYRKDCKLIYKGVIFDSLELESILILKLNDVEQKGDEQ